MADQSQRWFLALGAAALLVTASLGGLVVLRKKRASANTANPAAASTTAPSAPAASEPALAACGPQRSDFHPLPDAEFPPVILWAAGGARLYLDDAAAFSPPESPKRFPPGEHSV